MALLRNAFTQTLVKKGYEVFWDAYQGIPSVWENFFREDNTNAPYVERSSMIGLGDLMEKPENEPFKEDQPADGWPVLGRVRTFGRSMAWSMELYEDTQIEGLFEQVVTQWGDSYQRTKDRWYVRFFNDGALEAGADIFDNTVPGVKQDPTGKFIYDGKPFFADAGSPHPTKLSDITITNYFPVPLTFDNFSTVWHHMVLNNAYDEKGDEIDLYPDTLLIHPSNRFKAMEILNSEFLPHTDTTPSIRNPLRGTVDAVIEWRRLADPDGWFLIQRGQGLRALNRKNLELDVWIDPETKQIKASVNCRFGGYVDNCRYHVACNIPQT